MLLVAHRMPRTSARCARFSAAGADLFEWDVQLDRRGAVVVSHYLPLLGVRGWVQHDNAALRWRGGRGDRRDLPLARARELLPAGAGVLLDPKETDPRRRARLADALTTELGTELGTEPVRYRVSTDDPHDVERYRARGFSTWRTIKSDRDLDAETADGFSVRHTLLSGERLAGLHARAPLVVAWTVNDPARARALRDLGVDGITTDHPEVMDAVRRA